MKNISLFKRLKNLFLGLWAKPIKEKGVNDKQGNTLATSNDVMQKIVLKRKKKPQDEGMASKERYKSNNLGKNKAQETQKRESIKSELEGNVCKQNTEPLKNMCQENRKVDSKPKISLKPKKKSNDKFRAFER